MGNRNQSGRWTRAAQEPLKCRLLMHECYPLRSPPLRTHSHLPPRVEQTSKSTDAIQKYPDDPLVRLARRICGLVVANPETRGKLV